MIRVKATREGLIGKFVRLWNPANGKSAVAIVLDKGPWNTHDASYVFQPLTEPAGSSNSQVRPQAESGKDTCGTRSG